MNDLAKRIQFDTISSYATKELLAPAGVHGDEVHPGIGVCVGPKPGLLASVHLCGLVLRVCGTVAPSGRPYCLCPSRYSHPTPTVQGGPQSNRSISDIYARMRTSNVILYGSLARIKAHTRVASALLDINPAETDHHGTVCGVENVSPDLRVEVWDFRNPVALILSASPARSAVKGFDAFVLTKLPYRRDHPTVEDLC